MIIIGEVSNFLRCNMTNIMSTEKKALTPSQSQHPRLYNTIKKEPIPTYTAPTI